MKSIGTDTVSYFFCRYDDSDSTSARTIVGGIARQLLHGLTREAYAQIDTDMQAATLEVEDILEILKATLLPDRQYFIVIDGLNECDDTEIQQTIGILDSLLKSPHLKIKLFTSCRTSSMAWSTPTAWPLFRITINHADVKTDIDHYIQVMLEKNLKDDILQVGNPHIILAIEEALRQGAQGMSVSIILLSHNRLKQTDIHKLSTKET